jgi:hypothetical protein
MYGTDTGQIGARPGAKGRRRKMKVRREFGLNGKGLEIKRL